MVPPSLTPDVATSLPINLVAERLWLGPVPKTPEFIRGLAEDVGVRSLLSVQTDEDLTAVGMNWGLLWSFLMRSGINANRVPIEDFNDDALRAGLSAAVAALQSAMQTGRPVYLHCTAGVNRSTTVAIGWLVRHGGLSLDAAWEQVTTARPVAEPNRRALQAWLSAA